MSYWIKEDSKNIKEKLEKLVEGEGFENLFWDDIIKDNIEEFDINVNKIKSTVFWNSYRSHKT